MTVESRKQAADIVDAGGDVTASKVLLAYVVGKPAEAVDPGRLALEAWRLIQSRPTAAAPPMSPLSSLNVSDVRVLSDQLRERHASLAFAYRNRAGPSIKRAKSGTTTCMSSQSAV